MPPPLPRPSARCVFFVVAAPAPPRKWERTAILLAARQAGGLCLVQSRRVALGPRQPALLFVSAPGPARGALEAACAAPKARCTGLEWSGPAGALREALGPSCAAEGLAWCCLEGRAVAPVLETFFGTWREKV